MNRPYKIERVDDDRAIIRFLPGDVTMNRTAEHFDELLETVDKHNRIAVDLSRSPLVPSDWLRAIERMRIRAVTSGKDVIIVGASSTIKETADALQLGKVMKWCDTIEEAWAL